jgi:hypothetical protein
VASKLPVSYLVVDTRAGFSGLADRFIRGLPRAEDRVDEHCGVEDSAQAAKTGSAPSVHLSVNRAGTRVDLLSCR